MKKAMLLFLLVVLSVLIGAAGAAAETAAEPADAEADWTVMFYLCGSDLESQYGFATGNLKELMNCKAPASYLADLIEEEDPSFDRSTIEQQGRVNVLIETGGCAQFIGHCRAAAGRCAVRKRRRNGRGRRRGTLRRRSEPGTGGRRPGQRAGPAAEAGHLYR